MPPLIARKPICKLIMTQIVRKNKVEIHNKGSLNVEMNQKIWRKSGALIQ